MSTAIRLHRPLPSPASPRRLNPFPGRALTEQDLDLMQRYVERRCAPLLAHATPGIVDGLQAGIDGDRQAYRILVQPGTAVDARGQVVALFFPMTVAWEALLPPGPQPPGTTPGSPAVGVGPVSPVAPGPVRPSEPGAELPPARPLRDGFYFLSLQRGEAIVDDGPATPPCARDELDPLRPSRVATFARLALHLIEAGGGLMAMPEARAVNRLCAHFLEASPFDPRGGVPLALLKVVEARPTWFDPLAGRFAARPDAAWQTLLTHYESVLAGPGRARGLPPSPPPALPDPSGRGLAEALGVDYLPAAGPFPPWVADIAGEPARGADGPVQGWTLPRLAFRPDGLQIELLPLPASTVNEIVHRELRRGPIAIGEQTTQRIRILVAVSDSRFHPALLDLPATDGALEQALRERAQRARQAYQDWLDAYARLYQGLDRTPVDSDEPAPRLMALFGGVQMPPAPVDFFPALSDALRQALRLVDDVVPPPDPEHFFTHLVEQRRAQLAEGEVLPPPYSLWPAGQAPEPEAPVSDYEDGLYREQAELQTEIRALEEDLTANFELLEACNDFLGLQRQQLDVITVSFSALAGGVAGDGTGLNLMRWATETAFVPEKQTDNE